MMRSSFRHRSSSTATTAKQGTLDRYCSAGTLYKSDYPLRLREEKYSRDDPASRHFVAAVFQSTMSLPFLGCSLLAYFSQAQGTRFRSKFGRSQSTRPRPIQRQIAPCRPRTYDRALRPRQLAEKARAGFSFYVPRGEADRLRRVLVASPL